MASIVRSIRLMYANANAAFMSVLGDEVALDYIRKRCYADNLYWHIKDVETALKDINDFIRQSHKDIGKISEALAKE